MQFSQFPADLCFSALNEDDGRGDPVHPEELLLSKHFKNTARKNSFLLGRKAARSALRRLGVPDSEPVLRGAGDEPVWPKGIAGSIAHRGPYAVAVVSAGSYAGVGIDLELRAKRFAPGIAKRICTPREIELLPAGEELRTESDLQILKIFSAKEAFYKAVYPLLQRFLGFRDVELLWIGERFEGRILVPKSAFESELKVPGQISLQGEVLLSLAFLKSPK